MSGDAEFHYRLGDRVVDVTRRTLVMGILNRTPDSFFDRGATYELDNLLHKAEQLVEQGADILDVGGVKAGPGPEVEEAEELDTWRASVLDAACAVGAVIGNDISGFGDPDYLRVAAKHDASVVATHIRLKPRVPDPEPHYADLLGDVTEFLLDRAHQAEAAGLARNQISIDAGLDLGKSELQSAVLLRESDALAAHGYTLLLSASNKRFFGVVLGLELEERRAASLASVAYGVMHGCRIVRVHDVAGTVQVCRTVEAILEAYESAGPVERAPA